MGSDDILVVAGVLVRLVLAMLLILAGTMKARDFGRSLQIGSPFGFSERFVSRILLLLSVFEIFLGAWLLSGVRISLGLLSTALLLGGFVVILAILVFKGYRGNCACFGEMDKHQIGPIQIVRNLFLLWLAVLAWRVSLRSYLVGLPLWELSSAELLMSLVGFVSLIFTYLFGVQVSFFLSAASPESRGEHE